MKKLILSSLLVVAALSGGHAQSKLYPQAFDLADVTLLSGSRFAQAQELNIKVLLDYDTNRLLAPYLKEAGLPVKGELFPCWEGLDGHVGGHYLSALAIHYASTGDPRLKERMDYVIAELDRAQQANGNGYLGGVPNGAPMWQAIKGGDVGQVWKYWVPWYNVHKTYAGLRDAWLYGGSEKARTMFLRLCDWGLDIIAGLTDQQMESMLEQEFGGMPEVYADAYAMTGDERYIKAARRFSHRRLLDSMAKGVDNLDNKHANTQVPKVVGHQRIAELTGDSYWRQAAENFWDIVTGQRSLSIGGNSRREHFAPKDDCRSYVTDREGPETCNTNNMLKLTEGLFHMNPRARYADFYERALYNHILSTQHPEHGGYVYFTPARPGHYRVYSRPNAGMWCCVGTGMENHGKYAHFTYTHSGQDSLYVNLFMASRLNWREKDVVLTQSTDFPYTPSSVITIDKSKGREFTIMLRHPGWCKGFGVTVNGKPIAVTSTPQSYLPITRRWRKGDRIEITLPMEATVESVPNVDEYLSVVYGPVVLAARHATSAAMPGLVADDSRWAHIAHGPLVSVFDTPIMVGSRRQIVDRLASMRPVAGKPLHFTVPGLLPDSVVLEPFADIHDSRYTLYFLSMTPDALAAYREVEQKAEAMRLDLDRRTVDVVTPGEQQPEADHLMDGEQSRRGNFNDRPWRNATKGGHFSYTLRGGATVDSLALMVRYWGSENTGTAVDILVDGQLLATEVTGGKWGVDNFVDVAYALPASIAARRDFTVTFRPAEGSATTGGIYEVRIVKQQ